MSSDLSPNLQLPYIAAAQAQKHVTHNEAIRRLDAVVQLSVLDRDESAPPVSPLNGDRYLVAAAASGAWSGHTGSIAAFQDGAWEFFIPQEGWLAWVADESILVVFNGTAWTEAASGGGAGSVNPTPLVGVNATADTTNRLAVKSPASLLDNDGSDHRLKINKASSSDTAATLYQSGYSGRAEIGLSGDDDLHIKVSADGSSWHEAVQVSRSSGLVTLPLATSFAAVRTAGDVSSVDTIVFNSVSANIGGTYDGSTGHFTVPATGRYLLYAIGLATTSGPAELQIHVNGINNGSGRQYATAYATTVQAFALLSLAANDKVSVVAVQGTFYGSGFTTFYGTFLG